VVLPVADNAAETAGSVLRVRRHVGGVVADRLLRRVLQRQLLEDLDLLDGQDQEPADPFALRVIDL
jgi:hypothetical protein